MGESFTIGVDFGTNSVRAAVFDCSNGAEAGSDVFSYPSGDRGVILDPRDHNLARQDPGDYLEGLEGSVRKAVEAASDYSGFTRGKIVGIGVDTTGSTPLPVDKAGVPLAFDAAFKGNPSALAWLWKDHTASEEAAAITAAAQERRPQFLAKCGNTYSSEWFWSKIWHCLKTSPEVFDAAYSWVELADYIPALLAGNTGPTVLKRGVCAAGHKGLYCEEWGGLPDRKFLGLLDPKLADLRARLFDTAYDADTPAGRLCPEWAGKLGAPEGIPIAIGAIDAHYGAVGAGVAPGVLVKIMGTSTCDCTVAPRSKKLEDVPGICGIVDGSILPGHYGLEAGQAAVGDIFRWFAEGVCGGNEATHGEFSNTAAGLQPGQSGLLALDWNNGNRSVLVDPKLTGLLIGQSLYTSSAEIYRALIEATAFGARAIIERLQEYKVPVERIVCCGGIAEKNPLLMQIYADVTGCTLQISGSGQTCALGAAVAAAVIAGKEAGGHEDFQQAQAAMTSVKAQEYRPNADAQAVYEELYRLYSDLHDAFGGAGPQVDLSDTMKSLIAIKERRV